MCRFLSADFEFSLKCPIDKTQRTVRFQAYPQLRGHCLDVVECNGKAELNQLTCGKVCRLLLETGEYWDKTYPESALYTHNQ
jgi:hypothetical protein